jgi:hypothetical protein
MKIVLSPALALAVLTLAATTAHADPAEVPAARTVDGYKYVFKDDPLPASAAGPVGAQIRVVPSAARQALIRPRTNFVTELLRSTEAI